MIEETLLNSQSHFGKDKQIQFSCNRQLGAYKLLVLIKGESYNPTENPDDTLNALNIFKANMEIAPFWSYRNGCNEITYRLKKRKKISDVALILFSLILAIICGFLVAPLIGNDLNTTIIDTILTPISDTIMGFLTASALILIFFSVISGMCGMGDISTFNKLGKKILGKFMLTLCIALGICVLVVLPFFPINWNIGSGQDAFGSVYNMILDIVPKNLVEPFLSGNTLQMLFIAFCVGFALLVLSSKVSFVINFIDQSTMVMSKIVTFVVRLLPIVIFINIYKTIATTPISSLIGVYKIPLFLIIGAFVLLLIEIIFLRSNGISFRIVLKKLSKILLTTALTASSNAVFNDMLDISENKLGVDKNLP